MYAYDQEEDVLPFGNLSGALILGRQASDDDQNVFMLCDDCSGGILAAVTELEKGGNY